MCPQSRMAATLLTIRGTTTVWSVSEARRPTTPTSTRRCYAKLQPLSRVQRLLRNVMNTLQLKLWMDAAIDFYNNQICRRRREIEYAEALGCCIGASLEQPDHRHQQQLEPGQDLRQLVSNFNKIPLKLWMGAAIDFYNNQIVILQIRYLNLLSMCSMFQSKTTEVNTNLLFYVRINVTFFLCFEIKLFIIT